MILEFVFVLLSLNHCDNFSAEFSTLIRTFEFLNQHNMGCFRPHSLLQECHKGTKKDRIKTLNNKGASIDP